MTTLLFVFFLQPFTNLCIHPINFPVAASVAAEKEILSVWRNNAVRLVRRCADFNSYVDCLHPNVIPVFQKDIKIISSLF